MVTSFANLPQGWYGSPYHYIIEHRDYEGGTPEKRYGLWTFNFETLDYDLYQIVDEKNRKILHDIADKWEADEWAERKQKRKEEDEAYTYMRNIRRQKQS
jgi:hypothetical protein